MLYTAAEYAKMTEEEKLKAITAKALEDKAACAKDPWEAVKRGWIYTLDERAAANGLESVRPLPSLEYLEAITRLVVESDRGIIFKSRQMMMSWLFAFLGLHTAMFKTAQHVVIQGKRVEDVDAKTPHNILGRARFIRTHLPIPIMPKVVSEVVGENVTSETYENASTMEAIPEGAHIIRGKVPSFLFMDEFAFMESGEENWNSGNPSASKLWAVSTPNGHEFGWRQSELGRAWDAWRDWPKICDGVHTYKNSRGIQLVFVHYPADPANRTPEAQAKRRSGYTSVAAYMREQEGDFSLHQGEAVFPEFMPQSHVIPEFIPDPRSSLYRGWDFGIMGTAICFMQHDLQGRLIWFDQILTKGVPLQRVILEVKKRTTYWMGRAYENERALMGIATDSPINEAACLDFGDPAADSRNSRGETDQMLLSQFGIRLKMKETTGRKRDLVEQVRALLLPRADRRPGLLVAKNSQEMDLVIAGFGGMYHYGKAVEGKATKETPFKDGVADHIFDSAEYLIDNVSPIQFSHMNEDYGIPPEWYTEYGVGHPEYGAN